MNHLLHVETSGRTCSVAVSNNGNLIHEINKEASDPVRFLNSCIRDCLKGSNLRLEQIEAISINIGPGAYTSLRAGLATIKGLCVGLSKPLIQLNGMRLLAEAAKTSLVAEIQTIIVLKPLRKDQYFVCLYKRDGSNMQEIHTSKIDEVFFRVHNIVPEKALIVGTNIVEDSFQISDIQCVVKNIIPLASHQIELAFSCFRMGQFESIQNSVPEYLMDPNITTPKEKLPNSLN
ncbi:MAG: tRNA (adenosine(37)-N6)-threonylcarbamoyltransferase complex dimerization subunit type 1 TsaB [Saprospiraceae bacterium]|nr:tRNA (adenosine(37)-N6)-threonylcarbamoyltransferase complex dimerization subunit type 1 TsaB [Candidatus Vicinibacter affinis]MBP6172747.1 tRNA (adenosine(37)-N6)-threonylcarbamoyltransferase complex dimerization subunit type 1 TsaB [Saprospiraceae bacterium]MBK6573431.1 tRNA (adenosine(37)-N6)-threonylcarbamoyltransferase complex dimerization subunit type 1 TsaB [Candidatus Vicinibacter affinis]MBK6822093.1 tRNA (adenosine(37)-N6)-threonylcarbamoyltransferase complex dimerization subunit ty